MGKQGPCHHCGITSTPLWRNGPPEKPILCNACGSRWRTKGTLTNYTPLHARENVDLKEIKLPKVKPVDHTKLHKRKPVESINLPAENEQEHEGEVTISDQNFQKALEEDTSNRSSSGSAISYSESCSHFGGAEGSEPAGAAQQNAWDSVVPSRKRTCVGRLKQSSVEKLTRDLHSILHQQASYNSESPEDDLLYSAETLFGSVEIGNGGVLLRHPNKATMEEESEASSLPVDNKFSGFSSLPVNSIGRDFITERVKRAAAAEEHASREKASLERFSLLRSKDSPLTRVDLTEVVNLEVFVKHLTPKDQQQLMKYMPPIDAAGRPEDLRDMFHSPQFTENLFHYQQLLLEGTFDMSNSCVTADECRTLKKLVLGSSMKAKWVEYHEKLKGPRNDEDKRRKGARKGVGSSSSFPLGRLDNRPRSNPPEKSSMKSPKRSNKLRVSTLYSPKSVHANSMENTFSFSPRACSFASPFQFNSEGSYLKGEEDEEEDLLMDVRPNGSFPDAELLSHTWKQDAGLNSISAESGVESASCNPTSSSSSQPLKRWGS